MRAPSLVDRTEGDVVLPVEGRLNMDLALEHALRLARLHRARIVLLYVTNAPIAPKGYAEYAKVEKVRDFTATYLNSLGEERTRVLRARVQMERIECTGYTFVGKLADAIRFYRFNPRLLAVILPVHGRPHGVWSRFRRSIPHEVSSLRAPILLVPTPLR